MPTFRETQPPYDLVSAVRADLDLPEQEWKMLTGLATPYQRRVARLIADPSLAPHGVPSTYTNWGCRCDECSIAYGDSRRTARVATDFKEPADPPAGKRTPLETALYARAQGWDLTPKAKALLNEYEAQRVIDDVI